VDRKKKKKKKKKREKTENISFNLFSSFMKQIGQNH